MKVVVALLLTLALVSAQQFPLYKQCDSQWGSQTLGSGPKSICQAGCAVTSLSMALAGLDLYVDGDTATPETLNNWLSSHRGLSGNLLVWGSLTQLGLTFQGKVSASSVTSNFDAGNIVLLNVRYGGHWVLMTGYSGSTFYVNDSGYSVYSYTQSQVTQASVYSVNSSYFLKSDAPNNFQE